METYHGGKRVDAPTISKSEHGVRENDILKDSKSIDFMGTQALDKTGQDDCAEIYRTWNPKLDEDGQQDNEFATPSGSLEETSARIRCMAELTVKGNCSEATWLWSELIVLYK